MDKTTGGSGAAHGLHVVHKGGRPRVSALLQIRKPEGMPGGIKLGLGLWPHEWTIAAGEASLDVDVFERAGNVIVRADLPGVRRADIAVEAVGDGVVISGKRAEEREVHEQSYFLCERLTGEFKRKVRLPEGAQPDKMEATYQDGVLELVIPLSKPLEGRRVKVEIK